MMILKGLNYHQKWLKESKGTRVRYLMITTHMNFRILYLALHMLKLVPQYLTHGKQFTVVGSLRGSICDKALFNEHGCEILKLMTVSHATVKKGTCKYGSTANTVCMGVRKF